MGEIIFSFFVGGWMVLTGVLVIYWMSREEKRNKKTDEQNVLEGGR